MHRSSAIQRLWYGVDHLNFYLRLDFKLGSKPGVDTPPELNLLWFYPDRPLRSSPIPLSELPDQAPLSYQFHHHLGINLLTQTVWFQEAVDGWHWHPRISRAQTGLDTCLEVAVPWADLPVEPDWSLRLLLVLSDGGRYHSAVPENRLVAINAP
jgi:hypothetical protein